MLYIENTGLQDCFGFLRIESHMVFVISSQYYYFVCCHSYSSDCHHQQDFSTGACPYCNCDQQSTIVTMVTDSDVTELALTLKTILHTQSSAAVPDMVQLMYT